MTAIIGWLVASGVPARFAKWLLIGVAIVLLVALLAVGKCSYDRRIIATHDDKQTATVAVQARAGEATAATERRTDDARIVNQTEEMTNATQALPDAAPDARQHARACVILRRQSRASGGGIPAGC